MAYGDLYMQWYRRITRSSIRYPLHIVGGGFRPSAPVVRVMLETIVKCYARGSQIQDEEILRICRTAMTTIGLGDQVLDRLSPVRDPTQVQPPQIAVEQGVGQGRRGRRRGRGRFGPAEPAYDSNPIEAVPHHQPEISNPVEVPQHHSEIPNTSRMSLHVDISPASSPTPSLAPTSTWGSSIPSQDTPSSFASLPFDQQYQRRKKRYRSPSISADVAQPVSSTQLDVPHSLP